MSLAFFARSQVNSTTNAASYATGTAYTPAVGSLLICVVCASSTETTETDPTSVTGHGLTFTKLSTTVFQSAVDTITVWVAEVTGSPTNDVVTASGWGTNRTGCNMTVIEVTGADLSGGAVAAIVASNIQTHNGTGTATSVSLTMNAAGAAGNLCMGFFVHTAAEVIAAGTGNTLGSTGSYTTPNRGAGSVWNTSSYANPAATWTTSAAWRGIGLEIVAATAGTNATITLTTSAVTASAALSKQPGRLLAPSATSAAAGLAKQSGKLLTPTVASAAVVLIKQPRRSLAASANASAGLLRTPGRLLSAAASAATVLTRSPGRVLATLATASTTLTKQPQKQLAPTGTASASLAKQPAKPLVPTAAAATATLTLIKVKTLLLTTSLVTASATLIRQPGKSLVTSVVTATAALVKAPRHALTTAAATATATLGRTPGRVFAATASAAATLSKTPTHAFAATATASATLTRNARHTLNAAASAAATLRRQPSHVLSASAAASAVVTRGVARTFTATATLTATLIAQATQITTAVLGAFGDAPRTLFFRSSPVADIEDAPAQTTFTDTPAGGVSNSPKQIAPPTAVIPIGYSNQNLGSTNVAAIEAILGRKFHGLRQNQQYTNPTLTGPSGAIAEFDAGRTLSYRSIQFNTAPGGWAAAATGAFDSQLVAFCNNVIAAGRWTLENPFWVCLHHEATTSGGVFGTPGYSAADHKAMWQHCVPVMLATGAPIRFAYIGWDRMFVGANGIGPPNAGEGFDDLDPGATLYSRIGSDPYNQVDSPGVLRYGTDAATLLDPIRQAAIARGMDWMIGEVGCADGATTQDHVNKAAWWDSVRQYLDAIPADAASGVCRAMLTTQESGGLYNWDSSAEATAAAARLGGDPYFV